MSTVAPIARTATYRLQFTPAFRFADAQRIIPYLRELGISHIYASPITRPRHGSTHGYDVCDPREPNPELGSRDELMDLLGAARAAGMGWLQDVVPNHLAASVENPFWRDVLALGRDSRWARVFDIDWEHGDLGGRILLPVLGEPYGQALAEGRLKAGIEADRPVITYGGLHLPASPGSIARLLTERRVCLELADALDKALAEPDHDRRDAQLAAAWDLLSWPTVRSQLAALLGGLDAAALDRLIIDQPWQAAWWRSGREIVGYRRFFAIDDLVGVRVEDPVAFDLVHALAFELVDAGLIDGLRVDHIDGLREPADYLARLRRRVPHAWLLVEKILAAEEPLPSSWTVDGTSGYEHLAKAVPACMPAVAQARIDALDRRWNGRSDDSARLARDLRRDVGGLGLAGDLDRLMRLARAANVLYPGMRDLGPRTLRGAIAALLAGHGVYRTYGDAAGIPVLTAARDVARADQPRLAPVIDLVYGLLVQGFAAGAPAPIRELLLRFQQTSGPVMAKGCEDTFFYVFNRWIACNEVGGDPLSAPLSPRAFIAAAADRGRHWPDGLNATSTHDTKRSEDVRCRLAALAWHLDAWERLLERWFDHRQPAPLPDDRSLILQTLVGCWPADGDADRDLRERLQACALKSIREARQRTTWNDPDEGYEALVADWLGCLIDPDGEAAFRTDLRELVAAIEPLAQAIGLAQVLLKCTLPGVPDIYQGCEFRDFSLVDPDNRRPVDYAARMDATAPASVPDRDKQEVLRRCLALRRDDADLWRSGSVHDLTGDGHDGLFAFAREHGTAAAIVLIDPARRNAGAIPLPERLAKRTWRDAFTGRHLEPGDRLEPGQLLTRLPCTVLIAG